MNKCPFQKAKSFLGIKDKAEGIITQDKNHEEPVKQEVTDILDYLTKKDLTRINDKHQDVTIESFTVFIKTINNLEGEDFINAVSNHIKENLSEYQRLKKELNNLHVKMFWEYFKDKLEQLGEHDFFGIENGELVKIPLSQYTGSLGKIQRNSNKENGLEIPKLDIFVDYLERSLFMDKVASYIPYLNKISTYNNMEKAFNRISILSSDYNFIFEEIYKDFIEQSKDIKIIQLYLLLEKHITDIILFNSSFSLIFPNTNRVFLEKYFINNFSNDSEITISKIKDFLDRQNKKNIHEALYGGSFRSQLHSLYIIEYGKYNEKEGTVSIDTKDVPDDKIEGINDIVKKHHLEGKGDGACPFAQIKSGTQNKNALIEEFEFFDNYMLKILEHFYK